MVDKAKEVDKMLNSFKDSSFLTESYKDIIGTELSMALNNLSRKIHTASYSINVGDLIISSLVLGYIIKHRIDEAELREKLNVSE